MRQKNQPVDVPQEWVRQVHEWRKAQNLSLSELGERAGLSQSTVSRALSGRATLEAVTALARVSGVVLPVAVGASPRLLLWMELGQRLEHIDEALAAHELADLRELVETLEARTRRRKNARSE